MSAQWSHLCVFDSSSKGTPTDVQLWRRCHCWRCQCDNIQVLQRFVQFSSCHHVEEKYRKVNEGRPFESRLQIDNGTKNHFLSWLLSHGHSLRRKTIRTHNYENTLGTTRVSECRSTRKDKTKTTRTAWVLKSCSRRRAKKTSLHRGRRQSHDCVSRLWSTIWTSFRIPTRDFRDTTNRTILALSNTCDHSWDALKNCRGRSSEKSKVRENKIWGSQEIENKKKRW